MYQIFRRKKTHFERLSLEYLDSAPLSRYFEYVFEESSSVRFLVLDASQRLEYTSMGASRRVGFAPYIYEKRSPAYRARNFSECSLGRAWAYRDVVERLA